MSPMAFDDSELPPRRETFLARYSRNAKMGATVVIVALLVLPPAWIHGRLHHHHTETTAFSSDDTEKLPAITVGKIETDINAPALNDQDDRTVKLIPAPDVRVTQDTELGSLPRIGEDGLRPWQIYARPFNTADRRPRVALIVTGVGLSRAITDRAITQLPPTVTLALNAQGSVVGAWAARARQDGHEIILDVPMEPFDYPRSDPGPGTLLTSLPNSDNLERLTKALAHASGYIGVTSTSGVRFSTDTTKYTPVAQVLHDRGLMVLDAKAAPHSVVADVSHDMGVPVAIVTQRLDGDLSPEAIATALDNLEKTARQNGRAVGITAATPIMITQLQIWLKSLPGRGVALAPLSAMVQ